MENRIVQRDEKMSFNVPDDVDGPRAIEDWYTSEHGIKALPRHFGLW